MAEPAAPAEQKSGAYWVHKLPETRVVDRAERLVELASGRRVIHLGFVDIGLMAGKREQGTWLHDRLARAATSIVGVDLDPAGVERARALGYEAYAADCQQEGALAGLGVEPADLVLAGELIEHLDRPGAFLEEVKPLLRAGGLLVLTTPNATRLSSFLGGLVHREIVSPEHVGWHSWRTLMTLLGNHGWTMQEVAYYATPPLPWPAGASGAEIAAAAGVNAVRSLSRLVYALAPSLADGLLVVAAREPA